MIEPRLLALPCMLLLVACGGGSALPQEGDGVFRVVHRADAKWQRELARTEMEAALARHANIALVYAHDDEMAFAAAQACKDKGRAGIKILGIGGSAEQGLRYVADGVLDATLQLPTGAAVAIDMALLAVNGITLPRRIELGPRLYTKATLAIGGTLVPGPSEFAIETMRRQHAETLTTTPTIDMVFRIGMVDGKDTDPRHVAQRAELKAAAKRYPQLQLDFRADGDDAEQQRGTVRYFIAQNYHAIFVSPKQPGTLAAVCKEAMDAGIKVIVLDGELGSEDSACFVGIDNLAIGRAAGHTIKSLLPNGGSIVEIQGTMTTNLAQQRHQGFARALNLLEK